jgi:hypothetical protein
MSANGVGAYGLVLTGIDDCGRMLQPAPAQWDVLRVQRHSGRSLPVKFRYFVGSDRAELIVAGGPSIIVDRAESFVEFATRDPLPDRAVVHPFLAFPAAVRSHWARRQCLHAGAVIVDGRAWAVVGDKEGGKSSTLAWLAQDGWAIATDDLLVVDDKDVLAGPRCIDLRAETARSLGVGEPLGVVGSRPRYRLYLDPVPPAVPLAGWIFLEWGAELEAERLPVGRLLQSIFAHDALNLPPQDPSVHLDLAALPGWAVRRPRQLNSLAPSGRLILSLMS